MTKEIPREPNHFSPTIHCIQRKKDREISWDDVAETIETGSITDSHKDNCKLFLKDVGEDLPLGVVANVKTGDILTVEWRQKSYDPTV